MLNVHIISHTHDDAGWLKNVDEYYIGSRKYIDRGGVQYIIDSVMKNLLHNPSRKFSYVEATYMQRWLSDNEHYRHQFKKLVMNGQMEILSGGWVMHDEACTHYNDIINQMTLGFKTYKDAFEDCGIPRTGWQIDPFGHSAAQADLLAQMGFDGMFFGRVSDNLKGLRSSNRSLEFMWEPVPNFRDIYGGDYRNQSDEDYFKLFRHSVQMTPNLFIGILPNLYQPPPGFCFDLFCDDEPIQDDHRRSGYNKDDKVQNFMLQMMNQARFYDTNHIIVTMGNDFNYQSAENWYVNLDKLIYYVNEKVKFNNESDFRFNLFYSTPGCYLYALNLAKNASNLNTVTDSTSNPTTSSTETPELKDLPYSDLLAAMGQDEGLTLGDFQELRKASNKQDLIAKVRQIQQNRVSKERIKPQDPFWLENKQVPYRPLWPVKKGGDFFPLVNFGVNFWTGYFTSRPTLKGMIREGSRFLQVCKQIEALSGNGQPIAARELERAIGIAQHHDAVTGTAKQAVTYDYMLRLHKGIIGCEETIKDGLKRLAVLKPNEELHFCHLLNVSRCDFTQTQPNKDAFTVILYNPLAWNVSTFVQIPVRSYGYTVIDSNSKQPISSQIERIPVSVFLIPERSYGLTSDQFVLDQETDLSLTFEAQIPALGIMRYVIKANQTVIKKRLNANNNDNSIPLDNDGGGGELNSYRKMDPKLNYLYHKLNNGDENKTASFYGVLNVMTNGNLPVLEGLVMDKLKMAVVRTFSEAGMNPDLPLLVANKDDLSNNKIDEDQVNMPDTPVITGDDDTLFLENKYLKLYFNGKTNQLEKLENKVSKLTTKVRLNYYWYGKPSSQYYSQSGAYLFRPNAIRPNNISEWSHDILTLNIVKGDVYQQARLIYAPWLFIEITLYENAKYLELAWTVGPIPMNNSTPKDIIVRLETDIESFVQKYDDDIDDPNSKIDSNRTNLTSYNKFYTDSNGRFVIPRYVNMEAYAKAIELNSLDFIPKQYYPMNTRFHLKDENEIDPSSKRQLGIVTDRAQGVTSLNPGDLEIMLHRRTIKDDSLGVGEPLNELGPNRQGLKARGKHYVVFDNSVICNEILTKLAQEVYLNPQIIFSNSIDDTDTNPTSRNFKTNRKVDKQVKNPNNQFIFSQFPLNLHLLTLYRWFGRSPQMLVRLEHIYSPGEHPDLSNPVTVDLKEIFKTFTVRGVTEFALGANQELSKVHRFTWPVEESNLNRSTTPEHSFSKSLSAEIIIKNGDNSSQPEDFRVTLYPMEIRTFKLDIEM